MSVPNDHPAILVFKQFILEMHDVGEELSNQYIALKSGIIDEALFDRVVAKQRSSLEAIFERYCVAGLKAERLIDASASFNVGRPEYDPATEPIVNVTENKGKIVIETQQTVESC